MSAHNDSRPRHDYVLPSGEIVAIIFDHGEQAPPTITFQIADGTIVTATKVEVSE